VAFLFIVLFLESIIISSPLLNNLHFSYLLIVVPKVVALNSKNEVSMGDTVTLTFRVEDAFPNEVFSEWFYIPDTDDNDDVSYIDLSDYAAIMNSSISSPADVELTLRKIGLSNSSGEGRYYIRANNIVGSDIVMR